MRATLGGELRAAAAAALCAAAMGATSTGARAATPSFSDADGIHVAGVTRLDSRLINVSVTTNALAAKPNIRILLPTGYDQHPDRRYPVLYLIHGTSGGAPDWTSKGDAERTTAGRPVIVVMPDIGIKYDGGGWCTDWFNGGRGGQPRWETFHIAQMIPWVDRNVRTIASRAGRAIFGLSQGGFCALSYAARHPDLFVSAGSASGADDIAAHGAIADPLVTPVIQATATFLDHAGPDDMFGPRGTQEINWAAHDPATLAANLRGMNLYAYTGNGQRGPLDPLVPNAGAAAVEAGVHELTQLFHDTLVSLGIPIHYHDYGPGTHSWPYWARDLRQLIGPLMDDFAATPPAPARIRYESADPRYSAWGWRVTMHRPAREFSQLAGADRGGFTLSGSGSGTVITPPFFSPHQRLAVTLSSSSGKLRRRARANASGRVRIRVPLGPGNPYQQYTAQALAGGTRVYTTRVHIRARR